MSYYIKYKDVFYYLDATADISVTKSGSVTQHPTADRKVRADNYIINNPTSNYSGLITDIKHPLSHQSISTGKYIDALYSAMDNRESVVYKPRLDSPEEQDWFITSLRINQNQTHGSSGTTPDGRVIQAFIVDISLEKITRVDVLATEFTFTLPPKTPSSAAKNDVQDKTTSSGLPKEKADKSDEDLPGSLKTVRDIANAEEMARFYREEGRYGTLQQQRDELESQQ